MFSSVCARPVSAVAEGPSALWSVLVAAIVVAAPAPAAGQPWVSRTSVESVQSLLADGGLSGRFLFFIDFDEHGAAWIANSGGLSHYDGYGWQQYDTSHGLPSSFVRSVLAASDGTVWVGTDKGLARSREGGFEPLPEALMHGVTNIRRIREGPDGTIWAAGDQWLHPETTGGLVALKGQTSRRYGREHGLPSEYVSDVWFDEDGTMYVLTFSGIVAGQPGSWSPVAGLEGTGYVWSIVRAPGGGLIVSTEAGLMYQRGEEWIRTDRTVEGLGLARLLKRRDGSVVTFRSGRSAALLRWDNETWVPVSGRLPRSAVAEQLAEGPGESLWLVGYHMLIQWEDGAGSWRRYPDLPLVQLVDDEGRIWFSDEEQGAIMLRGADQWLDLPRMGGRLVDAGNGHVWAYTSEGVTRFDDRGQTEHTTAAALGMESVEFVVPDGPSPGVLVIGRRDQRGLYAIRSSASGWETPGVVLEGMDRIDAGTKTDEGSLVLEATPLEATVLWHHEAGRARRIEGPPTTSFFPPGLSSWKGSWWLYGEFGLHRWDNVAWLEQGGVPGSRVFVMLEDGADMWVAYDGFFGGTPGIARRSGAGWVRSDVELVRRGREGRADRELLIGGETVYRLDLKAEGMTYALRLPPGSVASGGVVGANGVAWINTDSGVLRHDPDDDPPETALSAAVARLVLRDTLQVAAFGTQRYRPRSAQAVQFSTRVNGGPWSPFDQSGTAHFPTASLGLGEHTLEARSRMWNGQIDSTPARMTFVVVPVPLQNRWYFWPILLGALAFSLGLALVALRSRHALSKLNAQLNELVQRRTGRIRALSRRLQRVQEEERGRIARELHDEIGGNLTALSLSLGEHGHANAGGSGSLSRTALLDDIMQSVRTVSYALRPSILDDFGLAEAVRALAGRLETVSGIDIVVRSNVDDHARLSGDVQTAAYRIVQESLTNALRHSGARQIQVLLDAPDELLVVTVIDDGRGFVATDVKRDSSGLAGMRERAVLVGGYFEVSSEAGTGVRITARLPLRNAVDVPDEVDAADAVPVDTRSGAADD